MGERGSVYGQRKDGTELTLEAGISKVSQSGKTVFTVILEDVTARKRNEQALRESEERYRQMFEESERLREYNTSIVNTMAEGLILEDPAGKLTFVNAKLETLLGYTAGELVGEPSTKVFAPREHDHVAQQTARRPKGEATYYESVLLAKDNHEIPVFVAATPFQQRGQFAGTLATFADITERKHAEEQVRRQLQRIMALRDIDMAITSSLDVRVTLNVFLDHVKKELNVDAAAVLLLNPQTQMLEYAAGRGFRSSEITRSWLRVGNGYAGRAALERRIVNVPDLNQAEHTHARLSLVATEGFVAYYGVPLISKGQVKGVLDLFHRAPLNPDHEWMDFLQTLAGQAAVAIENAALFNDLERSHTELALAYDTTLEGWSHALDLRDKETEGHTLRVTELTERLARAIGIGNAELVHIHRGALLHDIGKMGVPDAILLKSGPLTEAEWGIMRLHPVYAYELLSPIEYLRSALDIPYCHHEKWEGTGYPRGLKGEQIPLAARLFTVVDVWDALLSDRPYRPAWSEDQARDYIRTNSGTHFDPHVVELFLKEMASD